VPILILKVTVYGQGCAIFTRDSMQCFTRLSHRQGVRPSVRTSHSSIVSTQRKLELRNFCRGLP